MIFKIFISKINIFLEFSRFFVKYRFWAILDFISGTGSIGHLEYVQLLQIRDFIWHFSHDEYQHGK